MTIATKSKDRRKITPRQLAVSWGLSIGKILGWIKSGELRAINVATTRNASPRFLIDIDDVKAFEESRAVVPPALPPKRRPRRSTVREYV